MSEKTPEFWMARAVELSRRGFPAPNPHVGCVIVRQGECVGEGWHDFAGGPHAEAVALQQAGGRAHGAEAYVTLEPCNHVGRTGPCSEALISAGVKRVSFACPDPNPKAQGGSARLREAGIETSVGLLQMEAAEANRVWLTAMRLQRPYVCLKAAMTLDGRIALPSGESQWITSEESRAAAHRLRAEMGAVLVGSGTVLADNPKLTARIEGVVNQPARIVLDPERALNGTESVFSAADAKVCWVVAGEPANERQIGFEAVSGQFDLTKVLRHLWGLGVTSILVEGGAKTIASFVQAKLFDEIALFIAPKVFGSGPAWIEGSITKQLADVPNLKIESIERIGPDLFLRAFPA
ncbi:MAG: bifunctional diaminohydroxyphosphoribosylaminopyrimidine deaminase/5-amino-6-(5-phosphoribosylamino)uracil reductase RibD [Fimbriimonadaceae bacterium]|nr:bifunctional diaminohydroxyphosphoribosylaminopyrimidine deaminase/5-amino-6-(5-phosphoribosylamino)uracil reductase RibD [Fimbriimonadaceae bacterium]